MSDQKPSVQLFGRRMLLLGIVALLSSIYTAIFITGGLVDPRAFVQFVVGIAGIATYFFTNRGKVGSRISGRAAFFYATSGATLAVLLCAIVAVNYIATKKPKTWDLTRDQIYSLSGQTRSLLKGLKDKVTVTAFYGPSEGEYLQLKDRLSQYREVSDKLEVNFIDPAKHPREVQEANISQGGPRVIVKNGPKESRAKDTSEEALTNAISEVTRGQAKKIYFSKGHGEHSITDDKERGMKLFADSLKSEGYQLDEIVLLDHKEMPADAQVLIIAGPVAGLTPGEAKLVSDWVDKGGKLIALIDSGTASGLESDFASWGIDLGNNEVIDADSQNPEFATALPAAEHPITMAKQPFAVASLLPLARSVAKSPHVPSGWTVVELLKTGARSWGKVDAIKGSQVAFIEGRDLKGPVPLAVAATHGAGPSEARVVVIGDSAFAANAFFRFLGNKDLALNSVDWAAHEEAKISIRPKSRTSNQLFLTAEQKHTMTLFAFDLLPFSLLFAGLLVSQTRKSR